MIPRFLISWGIKAGLRKTFTPAKWSILQHNVKKTQMLWTVPISSYCTPGTNWTCNNSENQGKPASTTATSTHVSGIKRLRSTQESFWNPYVKHFCSIAADRHPAWICKMAKIQCYNYQLEQIEHPKVLVQKSAISPWPEPMPAMTFQVDRFT